MNAISKWTMALTLLSGAAHAQQCTTLVYIGKPLTVTGTPNAENPYPIIPLTGIIVLGGALQPNLVNQAITPSYDLPAWDFSSEFAHPDLTSENAGGTSHISFSTDSNGNITAWNMTLSVGWGGEDSAGLSAVSMQNGDTVTVNATQPLPYGNTVQISASGTNSTPGTWTCLTDLIAQATKLPTTQAQVAALTAVVASLRTQLAGITAERDRYEALFRVADQEIAALEQKK